MYNEVDTDFKHNNSNNDITKNDCNLLSLHSVRLSAVKPTHVVLFDLQSATIGRELLWLSPFFFADKDIEVEKGEIICPGP